MKNLKTYESYLSDKMVLVKDKFKKLQKIIDFIEKYKLPYFVIATETPIGDFMFEEIEKVENDYYLHYYNYKINDSHLLKNELSTLSNYVVDELINVCEKEYRFTIEFHLETGLLNINNYINIFKIYKEPIKFTDWMFSQLLEQDLQDFVNNYKFQDILFSTHPEAFDSFMNECINSEKRSKSPGFNFEPLKLNPKIKLKYKNLLNNYIIKQDGKKYNL